MRSMHVAPLHGRDDSRIFWKECATLYSSGFDVSFVVGDGLGDGLANGIRIFDIGTSKKNRFGFQAFKLVREFRPDVIHIHEVMLLPFAIILYFMRYNIVYDVHEDYPRQVMNSRFGPFIRYGVSFACTVLEWIGGFLFARIVVATPHIARRFPPRKTVVVRNFPLLEELHTPDPTPMSERPLEFTYVGAIAEVRNIRGMIEAVSRVSEGHARLRLAGRFSPPELQGCVEQMPEWASVKYEGWVSRDGIAEMLAEGRAGLVVLKPIPRIMLALPIKLFEYMAAGLPVISSDFPVWREIVEGAQCGLLVDPTNTDELVQAMQWIVDNPQEAQAMGQRGRMAVVNTYNWDSESETLLACYRSLIDETSPKKGENQGR